MLVAWHGITLNIVHFSLFKADSSPDIPPFRSSDLQFFVYPGMVIVTQMTSICEIIENIIVNPIRLGNVH